jgi:hypothetical protein
MMPGEAEFGKWRFERRERWARRGRAVVLKAWLRIAGAGAPPAAPQAIPGTAGIEWVPVRVSATRGFCAVGSMRAPPRKRKFCLVSAATNAAPLRDNDFTPELPLRAQLVLNTLASLRQEGLKRRYRSTLVSDTEPMPCRCRVLAFF